MCSWPLNSCAQVPRSGSKTCTQSTSTKCWKLSWAVYGCYCNLRIQCDWRRILEVNGHCLKRIDAKRWQLAFLKDLRLPMSSPLSTRSRWWSMLSDSSQLIRVQLWDLFTANLSLLLFTLRTTYICFTRIYYYIFYFLIWQVQSITISSPWFPAISSMCIHVEHQFLTSWSFQVAWSCVLQDASLVSQRSIEWGTLEFSSFWGQLWPTVGIEIEVFLARLLDI